MPHLKSFIELKTPHTFLKTWKIISFSGRTTGIEPAIFGKPILFGPAMHNFQFVVEIFLEDGSAIQVADENEFLERMRKLPACTLAS